MNAYDNLAIQYFYLGDLEKSKYYNDRMTRGKFEAKFSLVRKMSENHAKKMFKKPSKSIKTIKSVGSGIKRLLSDDYKKDYSGINDTLRKSELF